MVFLCVLFCYLNQRRIPKHYLRNCFCFPTRFVKENKSCPTHSSLWVKKKRVLLFCYRLFISTLTICERKFNQTKPTRLPENNPTESMMALCTQNTYMRRVCGAYRIDVNRLWKRDATAAALSLHIIRFHFTRRPPPHSLEQFPHKNCGRPVNIDMGRNIDFILFISISFFHIHHFLWIKKEGESKPQSLISKSDRK